MPATLAAFHASLAIDHQLGMTDPGNAGWQRQFGVAQGMIGNTQLAQGNLPAALAAYQASIAIFDRFDLSATLHRTRIL